MMKMKGMKTKPDSSLDANPTQAVLQKARKVIKAYSFTIEPDDELGYVGWAKELPTVLADGASPEKCIHALTFALETAIAVLMADGMPMPPAIAAEKRTQQVNIRLTPYEKQLLMRESAKRGFRGVGDLIRAQTIDKIVGYS